MVLQEQWSIKRYQSAENIFILFGENKILFYEFHLRRTLFFKVMTDFLFKKCLRKDYRE